jgi:hypothetical protein
MMDLLSRRTYSVAVANISGQAAGGARAASGGPSLLPRSGGPYDQLIDPGLEPLSAIRVTVLLEPLVNSRRDSGQSSLIFVFKTHRAIRRTKFRRCYRLSY